jgi:hypothetical protein
MSDAELAFLKASADGNGRWGFQLDGRNVSGQSVLTVDLPAFMARAWTLNLLAMRFISNGVSPVVPFPPDTQVQGNDVFCTLQYGVAGALEIARFDYPKRGQTLQFHAATFRLYVEVQVNGITPGQLPSFPPLVGGFVTPSPRGSTMADPYASVTLTENEVVVIAPGQTNSFPIPARARAYRIVPRRNVGVTTLYRAFQNSNAAGALVQHTVDYAADDIAGTGEPITVFDVNGGHLYPYRNLTIPLVRQADVLQVVCITGGVSPANDAAYRIQWILDLG